jgi:hypothetical protein
MRARSRHYMVVAVITASVGVGIPVSAPTLHSEAAGMKLGHCAVDGRICAMAPDLAAPETTRPLARNRYILAPPATCSR